MTIKKEILKATEICVWGFSLVGLDQKSFVNKRFAGDVPLAQIRSQRLVDLKFEKKELRSFRNLEDTVKRLTRPYRTVLCVNLRPRTCVYPCLNRKRTVL